MVVVAIDGVVKELVVEAAVVCNNVPPDAASYQRNVPDEPYDACTVSVPASHRDAAVTVGNDPADTTVATTALRGVVVHTPLLYST